VEVAELGVLPPAAASPSSSSSSMLLQSVLAMLLFLLPCCKPSWSIWRRPLRRIISTYFVFFPRKKALRNNWKIEENPKKMTKKRKKK
jgi:hypothetical protein